jgi:hypothetical protein
MGGFRAEKSNPGEEEGMDPGAGGGGGKGATNPFPLGQTPAPRPLQPQGGGRRWDRRIGRTKHTPGNAHTPTHA